MLQSKSRNVKCCRFDNKVIVVTGSTKGIGFAIAKRLAEEGGQVIIFSRKQENVENALKLLKEDSFVKEPTGCSSLKLNVRGICGDVNNVADRQKLLDYASDNRQKKIDVLVANVATNPAVGTTIETTEKQYEKIFNVNVKCTFLLIKECAEYMNTNGSILIISSYIGYSPSFPIGMYGVSKTALLGLTKAFADDMFQKKTVRVNCIAPGLIKTSFSRVLWENKDMEQEIVSRTIMKRIAEPDEVAGVAAFLCSDDASYITAEVISVNGGIHCRL